MILIIPYAIFYYESEDPDKEGISGIFYQARWAAFYEIFVIIFAVVAVGVSYYFLGKAQVPYAGRWSSTYTASRDSAVPTGLGGSGSDCPTVSPTFTLTSKVYF